jgi:hypothetical protein
VQQSENQIKIAIKNFADYLQNLKIMKQQISATKLYSLQKIALASIASTETIT